MPPIPPVAGDVIHGFEARTYRSPFGQALRYRLYRPPEYNPRQQYPLVVFLHGSSGKGSRNERQLNGSRRYGTAYWTDPGMQERYPAFVLAPQTEPGRDDNWVRSWRLPASASADDKEPLELLVDLLYDLQREFSIDPDRLYLTGYSMGGFGTWIGISRHPRLFAAALPICGGGDPTHVVETEAAVWAFHGAADRIVPVGRSRSMVQALRRAGKAPRYTEFAGQRHDIWPLVYAGPELADWLFAQRRRSARGLAATEPRP